MVMRRTIEWEACPGGENVFETTAETLQELQLALAERNIPFNGYTIRLNDEVVESPDTRPPDNDTLDLYLTQNNAGNA